MNLFEEFQLKKEGNEKEKKVENSDITKKSKKTLEQTQELANTNKHKNKNSLPKESNYSVINLFSEDEKLQNPEEIENTSLQSNINSKESINQKLETEFEKKKILNNDSKEIEETHPLENSLTDELSIINAFDLLKKKEMIANIPTGIAGIDRILNGGLEPGGIIEFYGPSASGKTQICFRTVASLLKNLNKKSKIVFVDTEATFRPSRILQMLESDKFESSMLKRILVLQVKSTEEQRKLPEQIIKIKKKHEIEIIIVDSLTALFRREFTSDSITVRQQLLNQHLGDLLAIAQKEVIPVVVTNQVIDYKDKNGFSSIAVGGNIVGHGTTHRIRIETKQNRRIATVIDSPLLPNNSAEFII